MSESFRPSDLSCQRRTPAIKLMHPAASATIVSGQPTSAPATPAATNASRPISISYIARLRRTLASISPPDQPNALVQLQAPYHHCDEVASEKCLSAATFVRLRRREN